jgi:hypothetical protein
MDQDKDNNEVSLTFGVDSYEIKPFRRQELPPKADIEAVKKKGTRVEQENGKNYGYYPRKFTHIADALKHITTEQVSKSGMSDGTIGDMKNGV